jgi:predicted Zn-dependent protease
VADLLAGTMIGYQLPSLIFRTSAQAKYQRLSPLEVGHSLFGETPATGDALNVYSNSLLPYGLRTWAFDAEGLPGHRLPVVENGRLARWVGGQRYADYLNVPAVGEFGNVEIDPGSTPLTELSTPAARERLIQVVVWSFMRPDPITGDFVCEIRLGYEISREGKRPIKGGSVSGNLFTALAGALFSRETALMGHYQGPAGVRFPGLSVSGA